MRILVADDDEVSALVLSERLRDLGYEVTVAADGAEAWHEIQQSEYRLLILDWMMPQIDGLELCRRIRSEHSDRYTYIVILTGRTNRHDRLEALEWGADDFLTKPLDQAELLARLKAAGRILSSEEALRKSNKELQLARSKEVEIGAHIQRRLLYSPPPNAISSIRTASLSIPSQSVDGDFCDFFELGESIVDVVVGDVMGKGVAAAMVGAGVKTSLHRCLLRLIAGGVPGHFPSPAELVRSLDESVGAELIELETFLTLCYARFDTAGRMTYVSCGHPKIIHWHAGTGEVDLLNATAVPLGFSDNEAYVDREVALKVGDLVVFYSDGITDLFTPKGGRLGMTGFAEWVAPRAHVPLGELMEGLYWLREESPGGAALRDDFTCVAVRFVGSEVPSDEGLSLWADVGALRSVRDYVRSVAEKGSFDREELGQIQLAVQEAASNAVRHARKGHNAVPLNVRAKCNGGGIRIEFRYPGPPFDVETVPEPLLDGSQERGFGISIIYKCMDEVRFDVEDGQNRLVLQKTAREAK